MSALAFRRYALLPPAGLVLWAASLVVLACALWRTLATDRGAP